MAAENLVSIWILDIIQKLLLKDCALSLQYISVVTKASSRDHLPDEVR